ncbi:MAG: glycosyl hydrolase family 28-related protein [Eubacteriales bacterium]|nr:glycosyl hydrolase family 28-related protein [Eubacteriales bacterium]
MKKHHLLHQGIASILMISLLLCPKATMLQAANATLDEKKALPATSTESAISANQLSASDSSTLTEEFLTTEQLTTEEPTTENVTTEEITTEEVLSTDKTYLQSLIEEAQAIPYEVLISKSFKKLDKYLDKAITVMEKENSSQTSIDKAATNLKKVLDTLQYKATEKTKLKIAIDEAATVKEFLYSKDSYKAFKAIVSKAKAVYDNEDVTQDKVEQYTQKLLDAIYHLTPDVAPYKIIENTYYYNITDFGADGTDKKDDYAAIQAALDKAGEDHAIVVWVPSGQYRITAALYLQSNTTIKLDDDATIKRCQSAINDFNMVRVSDFKHQSLNYGGYTLCHDITIIGGTWDGGAISKATETKNLIYIGHSKNVTVSNTTIQNCYGAHALEFAGVYNGNVNHCKFTGFRYTTDKFTDEAVQLDICDRNKSDGVEWAPGYMVDGTTCKNIEISNNTFIDYPRGVGSHHVYSAGKHANGKHSGPYQNITIKNNSFRRSSASTQYLCSTGIFIMGAKNIKIYKNNINRYSYGIWVKESSKIAVKKNKLKYNNKANIVYSDNKGIRNAFIRFTVTQDKYKTKTFAFTCPTIKNGYIKTRKRIYRFKKEAPTHKFKLKKKIKHNQKVIFYGKDKYGNSYYRNYYTAS